MSVSSLFACALQVVVNDVIRYERDFPYLPSNVRTQIAKVMSRRGILNSRNMPLVLHDGVFGLDLSECALSAVELGLVWRLCPRLKRLDIGLRRGCRDTLHSAALTQLLSHLPSLLSLNLQSCTLLDHSSLLSLTSSSPLLTSLTLSGCHMVTDRSVVALATRLKHLQALSLAKTKELMNLLHGNKFSPWEDFFVNPFGSVLTNYVSSDGLIALSKGVCARVLKEVDISHCLNVTDDGVLSLLSLCPSLSILVFHSCPLLTPLTRDRTSGLRLKQVTWTIYILTHFFVCSGDHRVNCLHAL